VWDVISVGPLQGIPGGIRNSALGRLLGSSWPAPGAWAAPQIHRPFFVNLRRLYWVLPAQAGYGDKRAS